MCAQENGVTPVWDVRKQMAGVAEQAKRLQPLIDRTKPQEWVAKGAPQTWINQHQSARNSVANLVAASEKLSRDPERLTIALDTMFRLDAVMTVLGSLRDGVRKYQGDTLANDLSTAITDTFNSRETLKQHVTDLAATREQESKIMDEEAQRCRGMITRQAPPSPPARSLRQRQRSREKQP